MLRAGSLLLSPADRTVDMQQSDHSSTLIGSGEWDVALLPRASTRLDLKDILKDVDRVGRREE